MELLISLCGACICLEYFDTSSGSNGEDQDGQQDSSHTVASRISCIGPMTSHERSLSLE